jgi:hypothetical protein
MFRGSRLAGRGLDKIRIYSDGNVEFVRRNLLRLNFSENKFKEFADVLVIEDDGKIVAVFDRELSETKVPKIKCLKCDAVLPNRWDAIYAHVLSHGLSNASKIATVVRKYYSRFRWITPKHLGNDFDDVRYYVWKYRREGLRIARFQKFFTTLVQSLGWEGHYKIPRDVVFRLYKKITKDVTGESQELQSKDESIDAENPVEVRMYNGE